MSGFHAVMDFDLCCSPFDLFRKISDMNLHRLMTLSPALQNKRRHWFHWWFGETCPLEDASCIRTSVDITIDTDEMFLVVLKR